MLKRYGLALALAGLALFLRSVLPFREGTAIYQLPLAAVVLSAWYGGRGPGLLASLICVTGVSYWFVPPVGSFSTAPDHAPPFLIFIGLCLLLSEFSAGRRRTEHALRQSGKRFRTLAQFPGVYWETDAQHRFTRQEFLDRLTGAPAPGSVIGKAGDGTSPTSSPTKRLAQAPGHARRASPVPGFRARAPDARRGQALRVGVRYAGLRRIRAVRRLPRRRPQYHRPQARRGGAPRAHMVSRVDGPGQPRRAGNERRRADDGRRPRGGARDLRQRPRLADLSVRSRRSFLEAHHGAHAAGGPGRGRPRPRLAYDAGQRRGGTGGTRVFRRAPARWLPQRTSRAPTSRSISACARTC